MTETIWKPVKGYEGLYEVSNLGQVRSLSRIFSTPIVCRTKSGEFVGEYESVSIASKSLGIDARNISSVVNGRRNHTRGYVFERRNNNGN